jgi:diguanylate cyclase (GGDEF)-like protein
MSRATILVVEDSRAQADELAGVLEREGHRVTIAADGKEAIRRVRTAPPDLVFLDLVLPDMDGLEVLRIIKAGPGESFTPVILLSARADLDSRVTGLRIGADDFLAKPFADAEVLARAGAMLRIKSLQDQLRAAKAELERLSVTDGLTGLFNRRYFNARLSQEFQRAQRYSDPLSLLMLDIDHFKRVNDSYGHPFGDLVLKGTADLVRTSVRDPDICARYGGEEFAVILPKTHLAGALVVAERIWRDLAAKPYATDGAGGASGATFGATASLGLAFYPSKDVSSPEHLVKYADEALYRAKREGRNCICLYQGQTYRYEVPQR